MSRGGAKKATRRLAVDGARPHHVSSTAECRREGPEKRVAELGIFCGVEWTFATTLPSRYRGRGPTTPSSATHPLSNFALQSSPTFTENVPACKENAKQFRARSGSVPSVLMRRCFDCSARLLAGGRVGGLGPKSALNSMGHQHSCGVGMDSLPIGAGGEIGRIRGGEGKGFARRERRPLSWEHTGKPVITKGSGVSR